MTKNFYITTPIYYVNDSPHIGHAYTSLACDVMARYKRMNGYNVKFLTGTDEHGQKVEKSAANAGMATKAFVDMNAKKFEDLAKSMNYSNDDFIRTSEGRHVKSSQAIWNKLVANGEIYEDKYAGWYSIRDEAFFAESELVDGKAPTGAPVEWVEEPSYFFRLSKWEKPLLEFYEKNPNFIYPESRRNEVLSFVKGGLTDLSVSRTSFTWGIKVPGNEKHVMYVWLDALTNYITAVGYPDVETPDFKTFWPEAIHVVGKDIIRFHAVYWPAFLMAANITPPKRIIAHGWWTNEGQKISKSLGNVIDPYDLVNTFGLDQTRYYMLREVPFGNDGNFTREGMIGRINSELANNYGNLAQRTLAFINKNCGAVVPEITLPLQQQDNDLLEFAYNTAERISESYNDFKFHVVLEQIIELANRANGYIDVEAPWSLRKTNPERMNVVLYVLLECIRSIGIYLYPFMPDSCARLLALLNRTIETAGNKLKSGETLPAPTGIFPRFEDKQAA